jgi:hypothetical protein
LPPSQVSPSRSLAVVVLRRTMLGAALLHVASSTDARTETRIMKVRAVDDTVAGG